VPHRKTVKTVSSPYKVQVLDRAVEILDVLGSRDNDWSLVELSASIGLHKSTVHRLVMVLERQRLVAKNPETGRYRLGLKLFELGARAIASTNLREQCRPHLLQVVYETEETVHLCVLDEGEVLYVEKMEPQRSVRMASHVGRRCSVHCTAVGKAILAEIPAPEIDEILRRRGMQPMTRKTITTPAELKAELERVRHRGYAIDDEEHEEGVRCVGVVVHDYSQRPIAAISVSGPTFRATNEKVPIIAKAVMHAASALASEMGYRAEAKAEAKKELQVR